MWVCVVWYGLLGRAFGDVWVEYGLHWLLVSPPHGYNLHLV